mmetsp:Transcript_14795/g.14686  ORF Transcript_14795/g.14686 Transcript_14795/m.14686 type:complete len:289 (-) Transcript_14795:16-882(-)
MQSQKEFDEAEYETLQPKDAKSVIYTLEDLKRHQNKEKEKDKGKKPKTTNTSKVDDLLYDEEGNIQPYDVYQRLLQKKKDEEKKNLLLRSKAFFMSSVSKEDQYNQIHGIKEKLGTPFIGRYKPKYDLVDKKSFAFKYRKQAKKKKISFHKRSRSINTSYCTKRRPKTSVEFKSMSYKGGKNERNLSHDRMRNVESPFKSSQFSRRDPTHSDIFAISEDVVPEFKKEKRAKDRPKLISIDHVKERSIRVKSQKSKKSQYPEGTSSISNGRIWGEYLKKNVKRPRVDKF